MTIYREWQMNLIAVRATFEDLKRIDALTARGYFTRDMPCIARQVICRYTARILWLRFTYPYRKLCGRSGPRQA